MKLPSSIALLALTCPLGAAPLFADFDGTGGPGGNFDWYIPAGTTVIIDTTSDTIVGGPGGVPVTTQTVINGVIDVRNMRVEAGALLLFQGPNPATILATGFVEVFGEISLDGTSSAGVGGLNQTHQPEPGAPGQAGGGAGGTGSYLTNQSTPVGGAGFGAYNVPGLGGQGGETSYHPTSKNARRGAGGGGGRMGGDIFVDWIPGMKFRAQSQVGMDAEPGFGGGPDGTGALSQTERARGGAIGASPFMTPRTNDDFLGTMVTAGGGLIQGELTRVTPGAGGGAGGDSVRSDSFPLVPFTSTGDEKGAGGGGGAGALHVLALGDIRIGTDGSIHADGGTGNGGENTNFFDRVGGGSGGGSGGHIVLESNANLIFEGSQANAGLNYDDLAFDDRRRPISALGGQGGAGENSKGGAGESGATPWRCDAIPFRAFLRGVVTPPLTETCFQALPGVGFSTNPFDWDDPDNQAVAGAGGDGSPGTIQLHANSLDNIQLPASADGDATQVFVPPPVGWSGGAFRGRLALSFNCLTGPPTWTPLGAPHQSPGDSGDSTTEPNAEWFPVPMHLDFRALDSLR